MPDTEEQKTEKRKGEKKRLRVSSSEDREDAIVELKVSEFQHIINRITKIEEEAKHREARSAKLETEFILTKEEAVKVKHTSLQLENSLQFTQKEQEEVLERINECEREQAADDNDIFKQEI